MEQPTPRVLFRSTHDRIIAGVAGGLGEYLKVDSNLIRLVFVLLTLPGGLMVPLYLLAWLLIPAEDDVATGADHLDEVKARVRKVAEEARSTWETGRGHRWVGLFLILLGLLFLLGNFGFYSFNLIGRLWPLLLILIGWYWLSGRRQ